MGTQTPNLGLYKSDPADHTEMFSLENMINSNWDKLDVLFGTADWSDLTDYSSDWSTLKQRITNLPGKYGDNNVSITLIKFNGGIFLMGDQITYATIIKMSDDCVQISGFIEVEILSNDSNTVSIEPFYGTTYSDWGTQLWTNKTM